MMRLVNILNLLAQPFLLAGAFLSRIFDEAYSRHIAVWSILAVCAGISFFFVPVAWISIAAGKMLMVIVLVSLALLLWILVSLKQETLVVPKSLLLAAALLVPLGYLVSALATGASRESFIGSGGQDTVATLAIFFALFFVSAQVFAKSSKRPLAALQSLLVGGALLLAIQLLHLVFPSLTFGEALIGSAASVLGSWHDLGIFLGFLLFLSLSVLPVLSAGLLRAALWGIAAASGALLLIVNSPDVWIGVSALGFLYAAYTWRLASVSGLERGTLLRRARWWLLLAVVALGLCWGNPILQRVLPAPLQVVQLEVRPSWEGTFAIGKEVFAQPGSVFFGSGPNTFPRAWGLYKPLSVNETQFWNTDFYSGVGLIPTSFVTVGVLGVIAWGAVLVALLRSAWRALSSRAVARSATYAITAAGALYLAAFHVLYIPGPALSALAFLVFGLLVAEEWRAGTIREYAIPLGLAEWKGKVFVALLCLVGLVVAYTGVQSLRALLSESLVNRAAIVYNREQNIEAASRSIALALAVESQNDRAHRAAVELGILQLARLAATGDTSEAARAELQSVLTATIQHGVAAVSIQSRDYQNWLELARLYGELAGVGMEGMEANARAAYAQVAKDNPTSPLPALGEAQLDLLAKNDAAARTHLQAAIALKPSLALAHFLLSQIEARASNLDVARDEAILAVQYAEQDPLGWYNLGAVFYARGEYAEASESLKRALGLENNYANALFLLGLSSYKQGNTAESLSAFEAAAALNPDDEALKKIIADLKANQDPFATTPAL